MNTHSPFKSAYLRFLQLVSAVESMPGLEGFDANERALFDSLVLNWSLGKSLTVREAIYQPQLGSPATLHKRLKRLIAKELIITESKAGDRRTKYLHPSPKGQAYISLLSEHIKLAKA